ncbi:MAG: hypothetical protein ACXV4A_10240 [Actinomycetes bacterium]
MSPTRRTSAAVRRTAPLLAAVTVLAVLLGGAWALRGSTLGTQRGGGTGPLPVLRLTDDQPRWASGATNNRWHLDGALPTAPAEAPVRTFGRPSPDKVTALARALGLGSKARPAGGSTTFRGAAGTLQVQDAPGGQWRFTAAGLATPAPTLCPSTAVGQLPKTSVITVPTCDVASPMPLSTTGGGSPTTAAAPPPSSAKALQIAGPVLAAVGIVASTARTVAGGDQVTVVADPEVGGHPTDGFTTDVTVAGARIMSAGGWLGASTEGRTYPLVTARQAWETLIRTPLPEMLTACPQPLPPGADPLVCGGPVTVTGARLGLSLRHQGAAPLLVPAWLFQVRGSTRLLPVVAVQPSYLGSVPTPSTGGGGGSTGTAAPPTSGAPPRLANPGTRFQTYLPVESDDALEVTFTGGVESCFAYRVAVQETANSVRLSLAETRRPGHDVCNDMAQIYQRRVPLARPLGDRRVIDAESGVTLQQQSP